MKKLFRFLGIALCLLSPNLGKAQDTGLFRMKKDLPPENDINEVAVQLARINDQLTIRNRRWRRFWLGVLFVFLAFVLFTVLGMALFTADTRSGPQEGPTIEMEWSEDEAVDAEGADS